MSHFEVSEAWVPVVAVMIGGLITAGFTAFLQYIERRARSKERYHDREIAASATLVDALSRMLSMEDEPEIEGPPATKHNEWTSRRNVLLLVVQTAPLDLRDQKLRARLAETHRLLGLYHNARTMAGLSERSVRWIGCDHALECLGAFRRGESLPQRPESFNTTLASIDELEQISSD